jgi:hypothetical protein
MTEKSCPDVRIEKIAIFRAGFGGFGRKTPAWREKSGHGLGFDLDGPGPAAFETTGTTEDSYTDVRIGFFAVFKPNS